MLTLAQKTSQVLLHMAVAFGVTYAFTGSLTVGGIAAVIEPICNVLILPLHDRIWARVREASAAREHLARDQHGVTDIAEHRSGNTAEEQLPMTGFTVGAHDDEVRGFLLRNRPNHLMHASTI